VLNVNDNPPQFLSTLIEERIDENVEPGMILASVSATDADQSSSLAYSLIPSQGSEKFGINATTGVVSLAGYLDAEEFSKYILTGFKKSLPCFNLMFLNVSFL